MSNDKMVLKQEVLVCLNEVNEKLNNKESYTVKYLEAIESTVEMLYEGVEGDVEDVLNFYFQVLFAVESGDLVLDRSRKKGEVFQFGFKELDTIFLVLDSVGKDSSEAEKKFKAQLRISDLRDKSLYDLDGHDFVDDLTVVRASLGLETDLTVVSEDTKKALEKPEDKNKEKVAKLQEIEDLKVLVKTSIGVILDVYDKTIALGFQLDPFKAMLIENTVAMPTAPATLMLKGQEAVKMASLKAQFTAKAVREAMPDVIVSFDRQVDLEQIYTRDMPIYYPLKIAEFALGSTITTEAGDMVYTRISARTWTRKSGNGYTHRGAIEKYLTKQMWDYMVIIIEKNNLQGAVDEGMIGIEASNLISSYLTRFVETFCTFAILKDYTGTTTEWASADIIMVAPEGKIIANPMEKLISDVFDNNGKLEKPLGGVHKGIEYKFFKHVANAKVAEAAPLFAYKALETLQATGQEVDVNNFVLGRDLNGGIVTSSANADAVINLRLNLIHGIFSGSRQGKGVMTSTAVATSAGAGRPVFGSDRKPDTMVQFYEASGGSDDRGTPKGYYVNGGAFNPGFMSPKFAAELDWDKNPLIRSRWTSTTPSWWNISSYNGFLGDMVYYRHILLTLGIVCLRVAMRSESPDTYEKLGGDQGIFVIYDEITNWQNSFMLQYINPRGANSLFGDDIFYTIDKEQELKNAKIELRNENLKETNRIKYEDIVKAANKDSYKKGVYARDLFYNLNKSLLFLEEQANAGIRGGESMFSDIYIIGQALEVTGLKEGQVQLTLNKSGTVNRTQFENNSDPLSWFLFNFNTDFIMGPNESNANAKKYVWRGVPSSDASKYLVDGLGRFGYFCEPSVELIKKGSPSDSHLSKSVEKYTDGGAVYFKPYLILNSADPQSNAIQTLERRLGDNVEAVKAMNSGANGEWHEAIGFDGYVKMMSGGSSDTATSFIKAREIADMVVQKMGYDGDYLDFLMDLRPEWNFSVKDVVMAFTQEDEYAKGERYKTWTEYQEILNGHGDEEVEESEELGENGVVIPTFKSEDDKSLGVVSNKGVEPEVERFEIPKEKVAPEPVVTPKPTDMSKVSGIASAVDQTTSDAANVQYDYMRNFEGYQPPQQQDGYDYYYDGYDEYYQGGQPENNQFMFTDGAGNNLQESPKVKSAIQALASALGLSSQLVEQSLFGGMSQGGNTVGNVHNFNQLEKDNQVNMSDMSFGEPGGNEQAVLNGLRDLQVFMTNTVLDAFGDSYNIESIEVRGGALIVNNIRYVQSFPNIRMEGLPIDKQIQMQNKQYAEVFDFACLGYLQNLTYLTIDSPQFMLTKVIRGLGLRDDSSVFALFNVLPRLRELTVAGQKFTREDADDSGVRQQSEEMLNSSRRRQRVLNRAEDTGRTFRRARWDSTKRYWSSNRGAKRWVGSGVHLTGAAVGTTIEAGAKAGKLTSGILKGAKRLFSDLRSDLKGSK